MTTMIQVITSDFEFTDNRKKEANILFMKPSLIHKLIDDAKKTRGSRYLSVTNNQVFFIHCPIVQIAENYTDDYVFLDEYAIEAASQFYKNERFDTFTYQFPDSLATEEQTDSEPSATDSEARMFEMAIPEHLVECHKRWQDTAAILEYQESLKTQ